MRDVLSPLSQSASKGLSKTWKSSAWIHHSKEAKGEIKPLCVWMIYKYIYMFLMIFLTIISCNNNWFWLKCFHKKNIPNHFPSEKIILDLFNEKKRKKNQGSSKVFWTFFFFFYLICSSQPSICNPLCKISFKFICLIYHFLTSWGEIWFLNMSHAPSKDTCEKFKFRAVYKFELQSNHFNSDDVIILILFIS